MREIKFRAWDKLNKRVMHFKSGFGWNDEYDLWYLQPDETKHLHRQGVSDVPCEDNIILMQYTGLKDKASNDIYESDIIKIYGGADDAFGEVVFEDGCFCLKVSWTKDHRPELKHYVGFDFVDIEIIGNIHERPSLLTLSIGEDKK